MPLYSSTVLEKHTLLFPQMSELDLKHGKDHIMINTPHSNTCTHPHCPHVHTLHQHMHIPTCAHTPPTHAHTHMCPHSTNTCTHPHVHTLHQHPAHTPTKMVFTVLHVSQNQFLRISKCPYMYVTTRVTCVCTYYMYQICLLCHDNILSLYHPKASIIWTELFMRGPAHSGPTGL